MGAQLFDRDGDGIITFGTNGVLDVDKTASGKGNDSVDVNGIDGSSGLRYLGTKVDTDTGKAVYAYADATVKPDGALESGIGDDTLDGGNGATDFFFDSALGLDLGRDMLTNFGADDRLVTTVKLFDRDGSGTVGFGKNDLLDLPGSTGPSVGDPMNAFGGQVEISDEGGNEVTSLDYDGQSTVDGVTYYFYSRDGGSSSTVFGDDA